MPESRLSRNVRPIPQPAEQHLRRRQQQPDHGQIADQLTRRLLQAGGRFRRCRQSLPDAAHSGRGADGAHLCEPHPFCDHRAGKQKRRALAAGWCEGGVRHAGQLGHRHCLAGEQGFVHGKLPLQQQGIRRNAVAFVQHQNILAHHFPARDAHLLTVPDHQCARGGKVTQGFQRSLRLALLGQGDADDDEHEAEQEQRLGPVAQREVDTARHQQHEKHWLGQYAAHDGEHRLRRAAGQQVRAVLHQAARGFLRAQAAHRFGNG